MTDTAPQALARQEHDALQAALRDSVKVVKVLRRLRSYLMSNRDGKE